MSTECRVTSRTLLNVATCEHRTRFLCVARLGRATGRVTRSGKTSRKSFWEHNPANGWERLVKTPDRLGAPWRLYTSDDAWRQRTRKEALQGPSNMVSSVRGVLASCGNQLIGCIAVMVTSEWQLACTALYWCVTGRNNQRSMHELQHSRWGLNTRLFDINKTTILYNKQPPTTPWHMYGLELKQLAGGLPTKSIESWIKSSLS